MCIAIRCLPALVILLHAASVMGLEQPQTGRSGVPPRSASGLLTLASSEGDPAEADLPPAWPAAVDFNDSNSWEEGYPDANYSSSCCDDATCHCQPPARCGPVGPQFWVRGGYEHWWLEGFHVPALVTTSPAGTVQSQAGVLGQTGTSVLLGDQELNDDGQSGGSIHVGCLLSACPDMRLEVGYLNLDQLDNEFAASSDGTTILARPFFNVETEAEDSSLIAFPNTLAGDVGVTTSTEYDSGEVILLHAVNASCRHRIDFLAGGRFHRLEDGLLINDRFESLNPASGFPVGTTLESFDRFDTKNEFFGGQVGISSQHRFRYWSLELLAKLALGSTNSEVVINGSTTTTSGGSSATNAGGLLALPTNIGTRSSNEFSVVPEVSLDVKYQISCRLEAVFGYSFLYWNNVARPGDQIDRTLNLTQLPPGPLTGEARPEFNFNFTEIWLQGLHCGLQYRF